MNRVRKEYFVEVEEEAETGLRLQERWLDEQGRLVEFVDYNYDEHEFSVSRSKFDPETGLLHSVYGPAQTETCMRSGVIFEEEYFVQGEYHRENGDAYITRNRRTGQDEIRTRWINGQQYTVTSKGFVPVPD